MKSFMQTRTAVNQVPSTEEVGVNWFDVVDFSAISWITPKTFNRHDGEHTLLLIAVIESTEINDELENYY